MPRGGVLFHKRAIALPKAFGGPAEEAGGQAALATRAALRSTLAASDGKLDAMSLPSSWTRAVGTAGRLSNSRGMNASSGRRRGACHQRAGDPVTDEGV